MLKRKADAENSSEERTKTFAVHVKALNAGFLGWIKEQAAGAPLELWTDGVEDYLQYAKQLAEDFKDVLEANQEQQQQTQTDQPQLLSAGWPAASEDAAVKKRKEEEAEPAVKKPTAGLFSFSATTTAAPSGKPPLGASLFGSSAGSAASKPASAALAFGALPSTGGVLASSSSPAFGGSSAPVFGGIGSSSAPAFGSFGSAPASAATSQQQEDEDEEAEKEQPEEVQLETEGVEILMKQRIKLMSLGENKKWRDQGHGTLTLRRATGAEAAGKQPYLVFTTDAGRVMLNAPLVKNIKPTVNPKTPTNLIMMLISVVDGQQENAMRLLKCESAEAMKQLKAAVEEHV